VIARVTSEGFHLLDAAPVRINAKARALLKE